MQERFETFTVLIASISRCIRKIKGKEVCEYDLKSPHVSCLYYLYKQGELTAKQLSLFCDEDKGAISRSVEYLEKQGFISCESKGVKRYRSPFFLTQKGEQTGRVIAEKIDAILNEASVGLSEEHRIIFYKSLALIDNNLKKICEKYGE